jgi:hypothetical protein
MADLLSGLPAPEFDEAIEQELARRQLDPKNVLGQLGYCGMVLVSYEVRGTKEFGDHLASPEGRHPKYKPTVLGAGASLVDLAVKMQAVMKGGDIGIVPDTQTKPLEPRKIREINGRYGLRVTNNKVTLSHRVITPDREIVDSTEWLRGVSLFSSASADGVRVAVVATESTTFQTVRSDLMTDVEGSDEDAVSSIVRAHEYAQHLYNIIIQD